MKAAFKALRNAGYHMFLIYEYDFGKATFATRSLSMMVAQK